MQLNNFQIAPNITFSSKKGKKYFNITFILNNNDEKVIKSMNYPKS